MTTLSPSLAMPKKKRNDLSVKVDAEVVRRAKMVASARQITLAEYLTELLRNPVDRDLAKEVKGIKRFDASESDS